MKKRFRGVLILNRRDLKNPEKGGAEIYTYYLVKALLEKGVYVEWFSSKPKGLKRKENIDGINFIRKGNEFTCHLFGLFYALKKKDLFIIDEFNGTGFFCFLRKHSIILIHQLYQEFWEREWGVIGKPFKFIEKLLLKFYRKMPAICVSESTASDLKALGFQDITIILNGIDIKHLKEVPKKEENLTLMYLGRLRKTKNPEDAIKAFLIVKKRIKESKIWIVGDGVLFSYLKEKYGNNPDITFWGYVDEKKKYELLKKAHFLIVPSVREGWGQVVIQANAMGTPAIGYRVQGLKDSIKNGITGFLCNNEREIAEKIIEIWKDRNLYKELCQNALDFSRNFNWENTKREFLKFLINRKFDFK